jgi:hypothetical protein
MSNLTEQGSHEVVPACGFLTSNFLENIFVLSRPTANQIYQLKIDGG